MLDRAADESNLSRAAGGGDNIVILGQSGVAGSDIEHSVPGRGRRCFHFADGDRVFARGQVRDADGETFPVDFLTKCRRIAGGAFNGDRRIVLAMRKIPADAHLPAARITAFIGRTGSRYRKPQSRRGTGRLLPALPGSFRTPGNRSGSFPQREFRFAANW